MTDLEKRLEVMSPHDCGVELNRVIAEGEKSEFADWVRLNLRNRREYLIGQIESGRLDQTELLKVTGDLRELAGMGLVFFTPVQVPESENTGETVNE